MNERTIDNATTMTEILLTLLGFTKECMINIGNILRHTISFSPTE